MIGHRSLGRLTHGSDREVEVGPLSPIRLNVEVGVVYIAYVHFVGMEDLEELGEDACLVDRMDDVVPVGILVEELFRVCCSRSSLTGHAHNETLPDSFNQSA